MEKSLAAARTYGVEFMIGHISEEFEGRTYDFEFPYHSPIDWLKSIVTDTTLTPSISWYPIQKFLCRHGDMIRIFDEPNSAKKWWDIQSGLPVCENLPHCFLPLTLWMDKGCVTKRVKKHPIILRAAFLPGKIRNASGNGGRVLIGYMPVINDPGDPADRNSPRTLEYANFKRRVYHKVMGVIFKPMENPSRSGMTLRCGDSIQRVLYPGIPIECLDGEEACSACACHAALANHPCPQCLVHHDLLDLIDRKFIPRTTETMRQVYYNSREAPTKTAAEDILKAHGLHATKNAFWRLNNSDPYNASSYNTLHSDDSGKWGHHLWPLVLDVLQQRGMKGTLAIKSSLHGRGPVGSTKGVYFKLQRYLFMTRVHKKDFKFYKQHATGHVIQDIEQKGEGFLQEVKEAYNQTNGKDAEVQMAKIDKNQEVIARIQMLIDEYDKARQFRDAKDEELPDEEEQQKSAENQCHWSLGAPDRLLTAKALEQLFEQTSPFFRQFDWKLKSFLRKYISADCIVVHTFKHTKWQPSTPIDGCNMLEEVREPQFVMLKYMIRGAHMIPIFCTKEGRFLLNDLIDGDIFLRTGN
ncbi:hypothetical protein PILCRDRAFT_93491 [Piloderma croceum F 1598]|uniref:Uncharacterized protein n=1 Tax=Piloderma croceum (strain F 1598) TaxID=765440 RepID=A0A0C3EX60_PILCF|nr:hypothetical protein PILCRDRAFT_93491 [Piloderma croceum F 1598]